MKIQEAFNIAKEIVNVLVTDFEATGCKEFILERLDITDETLSEALTELMTLTALMDDQTIKEKGRTMTPENRRRFQSEFREVNRPSGMFRYPGEVDIDMREVKKFYKLEFAP